MKKVIKKIKKKVEKVEKIEEAIEETPKVTKKVKKKVSKIEKVDKPTGEKLKAKKDKIVFEPGFIPEGISGQVQIQEDEILVGQYAFPIKRVDDSIYFDNDRLIELPTDIFKNRSSKMFQVEVKILTEEEYNSGKWVSKCHCMYLEKLFHSAIDEAKFYGNYLQKPVGLYFDATRSTRICVNLAD